MKKNCAKSLRYSEKIKTCEKQREGGKYAKILRQRLSPREREGQNKYENPSGKSESARKS